MPSKQPIVGPLSLQGKPISVGRVLRRRHLHDELGGNAQAGIATLGRHKGVLAFTGSSGQQHGYEDTYQPDGTFRYYGEGQVGDMELKAGNRAIHDHVDNGTRLFLFNTNTDKGASDRLGESAA